MKKMLLLGVLFVLGWLIAPMTELENRAAAQEPVAPRYTLRPIVEFPDEAVQCYKDGGKGALVADLDAEGDLVEAWEATCLVPVK